MHSYPLYAKHAWRQFVPAPFILPKPGILYSSIHPEPIREFPDVQQTPLSGILFLKGTNGL